VYISVTNFIIALAKSVRSRITASPRRTSWLEASALGAKIPLTPAPDPATGQGGISRVLVPDGGLAVLKAIAVLQPARHGGPGSEHCREAQTTRPPTRDPPRSVGPINKGAHNILERLLAHLLWKIPLNIEVQIHLQEQPTVLPFRVWTEPLPENLLPTLKGTALGPTPLSEGVRSSAQSPRAGNNHRNRDTAPTLPLPSHLAEGPGSGDAPLPCPRLRHRCLRAPWLSACPTKRSQTRLAWPRSCGSAQRHAHCLLHTLTREALCNAFVVVAAATEGDLKQCPPPTAPQSPSASTAKTVAAPSATPYSPIPCGRQPLPWPSWQQTARPVWNRPHVCAPAENAYGPAAAGACSSPGRRLLTGREVSSTPPKLMGSIHSSCSQHWRCKAAVTSGGGPNTRLYNAGAATRAVPGETAE
jgi:hypothetical protein